MIENLEKTMRIQVLTVKQACEILAQYGMAISENKLRIGLRQRVYPFGDAIEMKQWEFDIYENLLLKWIKERAE